MILHTIRLVIGRELRAARKPFLITTTILLAVTAVGMAIMTLVQNNDSGDGSITYGLGLVGEVPAGLADEVRVRLPEGHRLATEYFGSVEDAEEALRDGDPSAVVVGDDTVLWGPWMPFAMAESLADALRTLKARELGADLGLTAEEVASLLNPELEFRTIEPRDEGSEADEVASAITVIVMFAAIIAYGQWIGYSVADEKGSRVVELILGAVPPRQLLTGKLLAVGSMGLAQMGMVGALVVGYGKVANLVNLPDFTLGLVPWMLVWFLLGFGLYGAIYAAGGSLVSDTHQASSTLGLLNILPILGYILGLLSFAQGTDTTLLRTFSLLPPWAPMTMPGRIARGWAAPWEIALSVVLMFLAIYGVIWIAGRVYLGGVARATSKLGWREAFRTGRDLRAGRAGQQPPPT